MSVAAGFNPPQRHGVMARADQKPFYEMHTITARKAHIPFELRNHDPFFSTIC
jgi:hypothetical protein